MRETDIQKKAQVYTQSDREEFQSELREFIEKSPLYKKRNIDLPPYANWMKADVAALPCKFCKTVRPFREGKESTHAAVVALGELLNRRSPGQYIVSDIYPIHLQCTDCQRTYFHCWIQVNVEQDWIRKVGQIPAWEISIPSEIAKNLGTDVELYKRALTLMSQSYGLGACAYLRRLLENRISPILQTIFDLKKSDGATEEELNAIKAAIKSKNFTSKIEAAYQYVPASIVVDGENPLKLIHDKLSVGVHGLSEDECMESAMEIRAALEYVLIEINRQQSSKREFVQRIRAISKSKQR